MMPGIKNQNAIIIANQSTELIKKESGDIFLKKNKAADAMANTLTRIIISLISRLEIK